MSDRPEKIDLAGISLIASGLTYEEMVVGSRFRTARRTITEADLVGFITLVGITEPLFWDSQGSLDAGYSGRLVPGSLTFSYAEGLVMQTNVIHNTGLAFMSTEMSVLAPVFVGDSITVVVEVLESRPSGSGARGVVTARNTVVKHDGSVVMIYTPVRLVKGRSYGA
ncbi:MAG: hypothetical protein JWM76_1783 [Pseudonocardiales bacterium]|nr:hypothetical protein [Pseudonocardiales bacterium]